MLLVHANPVFETILGRYVDNLGPQAAMYCNHVYRGFNLHLSMSGLDQTDELALAWAAHDLGLWTAGTLDYLGPSARLAETLAPEFEIEPTPRLRVMIEYHHCLRRLADPLAEGFRLADRADAWPQRWGQALEPAELAKLTEVFPYCGFHEILGACIRSICPNASLATLSDVPLARTQSCVTMEMRTRTRAGACVK